MSSPSTTELARRLQCPCKETALKRFIKKRLQLIISLGLTFLIGYLIYRGVPNWAQAFHIMIQGDPRFILAGFCCTMLHMVLRAARWGVLLSPVKKRISYRNLFSSTLIKYVINVIPPRAGEIVASVILARKEGIASASVIASSLLERVLDMLAVVLLFFFYLSFFGHLYAPSSDRGRAIMLAVQNYSLKGFIVLCAAFLLLWIFLRKDAWVRKLPISFQKHMVHFLEGFRALQQGSKFIQVAILSVCIWLFITAQMWFLVQAYLQGFPFSGALFLMAITVVGVAIPTPGGVGGFQFFMNLALVNFFAQYLSSEDPTSQAAGISNGCYVVAMIPVILIGLILMNREGLSFRQISQISETQEIPQ